MKKLLVHLRTSVKLLSLIIVGVLLIAGAVTFFYKPIYSVSIDGEHIGYSEDKSKLQAKITKYIEKGEGENVAFVQVEHLPQYSLCLLKRDVVTNDDEIYEIVKASGTTYYKYYAIMENTEEKLYVASFAEAEKTIEELKTKNSTNKESLKVIEKYDTTLQELVTSEQAVSKLYIEPVKTTNNKNSKATYGKSVVEYASTQGARVSLGISFMKPISGTITSRYGSRWGSTHSGIDIAAPKGTPIYASSGGTVIFSGWKSGYGNLIIISHGNGVQTYYGHCSELIARQGQAVGQGQIIARVGSTGNSTGNHLHLEVRINGVPHNPQNYVY